MDRFLVVLVVCIMIFMPLDCAGNTGKDTSMSNDTSFSEDSMITVVAHGTTIVFELNNSPTAEALHAQLPLSVTVENFSDNEKIFYPPEKLPVSGTPLAESIQAGTLAYYAPWGNVVMFYGPFSSAPGLYKLGHAISGTEYIEVVSGTIRIEKGVVNE